MKTTLICTVGGSHEPIVKAIESLRPEFVAFVCSRDDPATGRAGSHVQVTGQGKVIRARREDDKPSLPAIPQQVGLEPEQFEVLLVQPDSLDDVYDRVMGWLSGRDRERERIHADYTGGTKTMSAALVTAALDDGQVDLHLVSGNRADLTRVTSGTEVMMPASVARTRFRRRLAQAAASWRHHAYDETLDQLESMGPPSEPGLQGDFLRLRDLSRAFSLWDRFDHAAAREVLSPYRQILGRDAGIQPLLVILDYLAGDKPASEPLRLYDLWRNAERRAGQGRYDDAMARVYRLLEWTAQWLLRQSAGIETADVPPDRVPEHVSLTPGQDGLLKAGLFNAWELVAHHGSDALADFWSRERTHVLDLLQARNLSILAHGFRPLSEAQWRRMESWMEQAFLPMLLSNTSGKPIRVAELPPQLPRTCPGIEA